MYIKETNILS